MKINAYVLAADPAWIENSVLSYYALVNRIVVSYDENSKGWTGSPISVEQSLTRLKAIDVDRKMIFIPGDYSKPSYRSNPIDGDTYQRQCALDAASVGADWVVQLDTDEVLGNPHAFMLAVNSLAPEYDAIDWPMRTLFQRTKSGRLLEVCSLFHRTISSYPGPIAVKANSILKHARQAANHLAWRCDVRKKDTDPAAGNRAVHQVIPRSSAILHYSWIRDAQQIREKLASWGHGKDFDSHKYLKTTWERASKYWPLFYNFHPMCPNWWPALRPLPREAG